MKKITLLFTLLAVTIGSGQNLVSDGTFDTQTGGITASTTPWAGFNSQVIQNDNLNSEKTGNGNNGEASVFQVVNVTSGETYNATFDYRWVSGTGNYDLNAVIRENATNPGDVLNNFTCSTTPDVWHTDGLINFTVPSGVTQVRIIFYKVNGNRPFRMDNVSITSANTASVKDLEQFSFKSYPNPANDYIKLSAAKNINKIEIYNLLGQEVLNKDIDSKNTEVNISSLSKGVYVVKAFIEDAVGSYKFIKQ